MLAQAEANTHARILAGAHALTIAVPSPNFAPLDEDDATSILVRGPNGIGKTWHLTRWAARMLVAHPGYRARFISPNNSHSQEVAGAFLATFLDPYLDKSRSYYVPGKGWNGGRSREILLSNGSVCQFRSAEDDQIAHSGSALDAAIFDEVPKPEHYIENAARVDRREQETGRRGRVIIGATMVGRPIAWLRKMVEGDEPSPARGRTEHRSGWVQYVARLDLAHCPWYSEDQIERMIARFASHPTEYEQRVHGAWDGVADDRYISAFSDHCITDDPPPQDVEVSIGIGMDHGHRPGSQVVSLAVWWRARDRRRVLILDEWANEAGQTDAAIGRGIVELLRRNGIEAHNVDASVGDIGRAANGYRMNETIDAAVMEALGLWKPPFRTNTPDKSDDAYEWGCHVLNAGFASGDIQIHRRCARTINAIRYWNGDKSPHNAEKHWVDASRYLVVEALRGVPQYAQLRVT